MGKRRRSEDPVYETHTAHYKNIARDQDINVIENVTEYCDHLDEIQDQMGHDFEIQYVKLDPRVFGLGVARARVFMVGIRKSKLQWKTG